MSVRREIKLSTTGTLSPVVFNDLGKRQFTHPTSNYSLLDEFNYDKLAKSDDLQSAINNGYIILRDENNVTINSVELLNILNNFANASPTVNDDADDGYSIGSTWVNTITNELFICVINEIGSAVWIKPVTVAPFSVQFGRNNNISNSYLQGGGLTWTNESPYVVPFNCTLTAISVATKSAQSWTAEVRIAGVLVPGASLSTTTATSNYVNDLSIDFDEGDEIQVYANGTSINRPNVALFFVRR